jgi:hypothetical protein
MTVTITSIGAGARLPGLRFDRGRGAAQQGRVERVGPRLQAAIVTLSVRNRISHRDVVELCEQLFSSRISTGTIDAIRTRAGDALAEPYADLLERVRGAGVLNMDETGWRCRARSGRCGARSTTVTRCSRSPRAVTKITPATCSPTLRRS